MKTMYVPCSPASRGTNPCAVCWRACKPKEGVLQLVWGVPMPLPVRSRGCDDIFWRELFGAAGKRSEAQNLKELGF